MNAEKESHRYHYSALFALFDYLDLHDVPDERTLKAIVNVTRELTLVGSGSIARLERSAVLLLRLHGGISYGGDADSVGWKRLVINTSKHQIEVTPQE